MARKTQTNPFKPTAGAEPPVLVGRDQVIEDFIDGLNEGPGAPGRLMRITGPRGSGKTVLLTELGDIARKQGWIVIDETARTGFLDSLTKALSSRALDADVSADIDLGFVKAHAGFNGSSDSSDFRTALTAASERVGKKGIMITIDEVQDADRPDMTEIATAVQHLIREGGNVVFVFAGITTGVLDFINDSSLTFLRRAKPEELAAIPEGDVADAFAKSFRETGMRIGRQELDVAAQATCGYAYLVQLVGYYVWRRCRKHVVESSEATIQDVSCGIEDAMAEYANTVILPALDNLPERAMDYLIEMSKKDSPSSTRQISDALGVGASSLTATRRLLISRQVIEPTARGYVDFSIPYMRNYVKENADSLTLRFG